MFEPWTPFGQFSVGAVDIEWNLDGDLLSSETHPDRVSCVAMPGVLMPGVAYVAM